MEDTDADELEGLLLDLVSEARSISSANDRISSREVLDRDTELDDL